MEVGVAAQGAAAGGEGRYRQVPADHQGDFDAGSRLQAALHRQGGAGRVAIATAAVVVAVGDRAVAGEGFPQLSATAAGIPTAAALHFEVVGGGDAPLALALGEGDGALTIEQHSLEPWLLHPGVAVALAAADRGHIVVLWAAVVSKLDCCCGICVGEPACGVAPAQQQGEVEGPVGGVGEGPDEHRHRVAGALVVARQDRTEGFAAHLGLEHTRVPGVADRVAGCVGAGALLGAAGGIPAPGAQGFAGCGPGGIGLRLHRQGMGAALVAVGFKQGELAVGQVAKPMFAAIEVPKVEGAIWGAADAAGAEAPQGHAVVGAVVEVAGITHRVGLLPTQAKGPAPATAASGGSPVALQQRCEG